MNTESVLPVLFELFAKSVLITLAAALLARASRQAAAAQQHLIWLVALATVLLLPMTRLVTPWWAIPLQPATKASERLPASTQDVAISLDTTSIGDVPALPPARRPLPDWRRILFGGWLCGAVLLLGYRLLGSWRLWRLMHRSVLLDDPRMGILCSRVLGEFRLRHHPKIRLSEECCVPVTWGSLRPVMLLPKAALQWNDAWLTAALRHEAAHIRRYDYLTRWLAQLACALYWPNPFAWLLARSLRLAQEQAADDVVLHAGTPAEEYATQLVDAARTVAALGLFVRQAVAMACPSTLEDRVRAIVDGRRDRRPLSRLATAFGSLTIALALAISTAAQLRSAGEEPSPPPPPLPKAPEAAPAKQHKAVVQIFSHFIEMAPEVKTTPPMPDKLTIWSDPQFQVIWRVMNQTKGVDPLAAPSVTTRLNQRVVMESIREFRHPKEWEKGADGWTPKEFVTTNTGTTIEVVPRIKDGGVIELNAKVSIVEFMGFLDLDSGKPAPPNVAGHRNKPIFSERKREDTVTLKDGETAMLPDLPETADVKPFEEKSAHRRRVLVFITPQIIAPASTKEPANHGAAPATPGAVEASAEWPGKPPQAGAINKGAMPPDKAAANTATLTLGGGILTVNEGAKPATAAESPALAKAEKIIIPKIELRNATLVDALDFLRLKAREVDPDKTGVNIVRKPGAVSDARITLSLTDVPLFDVLRYVAGLANLELVTEPNALTIQPPGGGVLLQAKLATPAATTDRVAITLSPKKPFQGGDGIEIREVTGSAATFQVGGTYRVRGVCRQATIRNAALYLGITAEGSGDALKPAPGTSLSKPVAKGATEFDFTFVPLRPGKVHVTLYDLDNYDPKDNSNAGLYLGEVSP